MRMSSRQLAAGVLLGKARRPVPQQLPVVPPRWLGRPRGCRNSSSLSIRLTGDSLMLTVGVPGLGSSTRSTSRGGRRPGAPVPVIMPLPAEPFRLGRSGGLPAISARSSRPGEIGTGKCREGLQLGRRKASSTKRCPLTAYQVGGHTQPHGSLSGGRT